MKSFCGHRDLYRSAEDCCDHWRFSF